MTATATRCHLQTILSEALAVAAPKRAEGKVADYIPALARVSPDKLGIAFAGPHRARCGWAHRA